MDTLNHVTNLMTKIAKTNLLRDRLHLTIAIGSEDAAWRDQGESA